MTVDPYRELARKHRQELQKVPAKKRESHEAELSSRVERRGENEKKKNLLLKILLFFFILLPFLTAFWYTYEQQDKGSSNSIVNEKVEHSAEADEIQATG
ncbi:hypothetical protein [Bacillus xiapuensis]|uniref:hypothetical protein n=1 Tax=Bacillus xiapuensis TaxID=2014075 RepID=UPI000C23A8C6|nr:hypothetical protein [Bacillus xiapuensis]